MCFSIKSTNKSKIIYMFKYQLSDSILSIFFIKKKNNPIVINKLT